MESLLAHLSSKDVVAIGCGWFGILQESSHGLVKPCMGHFIKLLLLSLVLFDLPLKLLVVISELLVTLLVVQNLIQKQVLVFLLTFEINVELLICQDQLPVFVIELLGDMSHPLKCLVQLLLLLIRVLDILGFLLVFRL